MTPADWVVLIIGTAVLGNLATYLTGAWEARHAYHRGYRQCRRDHGLPVAPRPVWTAEQVPQPEEAYWTQPSDWDEQSVTEAIGAAPTRELGPAPGPVTTEFARIMDHTAEQFQSIRDRFALRMGRGGPE